MIKTLSKVAKTQTDNRIDVWRFRLDLDKDYRSRLRELLSHSETTRAGRFHFDRHRRRYQVCHGLMRVLLSAYAGLPPTKIRFEFGQHGKPELATWLSVDVPNFNLSHSGGSAMLAIGHHGSLGVDVELFRDDIEGQDIARYFSSREADWIAALPSSRQHEAFLTSWVRKEAFIKALGKGLRQPLSSFQIRRHPDGHPWFVVRNIENGHIQEPWRVDDLASKPGSAAAIAYTFEANGPVQNNPVRQLELKFQ